MKALAGISILTLCTSLTFAQENYSQWTARKAITVNTQPSGARVTGNVTRFPLLVRLTTATASDVFTGSKGRGADIRFAKNDGTHLKYQIERWDSAGKAAEIWVLMDTVAGNGSSTFNMYWGKAGAADSSSGPGVFETTNGYVGVWHLGDAPTNSPRPNAVAGGPTALLRNYDNAYVPAAGMIGLADSLGGGPGDNLAGNTANYIDLNHRNYEGYSDFSTGFTFSTWFYESAQVAFERFVEILDDTTTSASSDTRIILFGNKNPPINGVSVRWGANGTFNGANSNVYNQNAWYHVLFTKAGGSAPMNVYVNGKLTETTGALPDLAIGLRNYAYMGRSSVTASDAYYQGKFDEPEIAKAVRDSNWAKLCYQTQRADSAFIILGTTVSATVPGAPTTVTGIAGNGQVTVSWAVPSSNGGAAITSYTATASSGGATCSTTGATSCTVIGLTNGTPYTFTVTATNGVGTGSPSAASAPVTPTAPAGAPAAPTSVTGIAGNTLVAISWLAPTDTGTARISAYTVTASPGVATCSTTGALTCTITGLINGTAYTFTVLATNSRGNSPASTPSASVTPRTVPGAPTGASAVAGSGQATVSWIAPASNGGSIITGYIVTTVEDTTKHCFTTGAVTCAVTGLNNNTSYTFVVRASNVAGNSAPSAPSSAVVTGIHSFVRGNGFGIQTVGSSVMFRMPQMMSTSKIAVMDIWGRTVWSQTVPAGMKAVTWNERTQNGGMARGIYFVRMMGNINGKPAVIAQSRIALSR